MSLLTVPLLMAPPIVLLLMVPPIALVMVPPIVALLTVLPQPVPCLAAAIRLVNAPAYVDLPTPQLASMANRATVTVNVRFREIVAAPFLSADSFGIIV